MRNVLNMILPAIKEKIWM